MFASASSQKILNPAHIYSFMQRSRLLLLTSLLVTASAAQAQSAATLIECAALSVDAARLQCYDQLAASYGLKPESTSETASSALTSAPGQIVAGAREDVASNGEPSVLDRLWELSPETKRGLFRVRAHHPSYLIGNYSNSPNDAPYVPFRPLAPNQSELSNFELAFQLSLKLKLAENPFDLPMDLWFGYTQRSFWQATNDEASSPFRATDYRPEVMAVFPLDKPVLGMRLRYVNLGLVHESNGQSLTLSRSWNRAYVQAGLERGPWTLQGRLWHRFSEDPMTDDNPDITKYLGHGDLMASYRYKGHEFSLMGRLNPKSEKGAVQLGWNFPLSSEASRLKGYVQVFSGYGQSLIDYNHRQTTLGIGVMLTD